MFVYKINISKKGNNYKALYWQFKSGKLYHMSFIPLSFVERIIKQYDVQCIGGDK